jgi:hypothetical protein
VASLAHLDHAPARAAEGLAVIHAKNLSTTFTSLETDVGSSISVEVIQSTLGRGMRCSRCRQEKAPEDFNLARNFTRGRRYWCRECAREFARQRIWEWRQSLDPELRSRFDRSSNLMRLYGLTLDEYDALVDQQDGVRAICREPPVKGRGKRLVVDHDHQTGRIRGLLCALCNVAIGYLREDPQLFDRAKEYLIRHSDHH